jgi:hypothetical protein
VGAHRKNPRVNAFQKRVTWFLEGQKKRVISLHGTKLPVIKILIVNQLKVVKDADHTTGHF